MLVSYFATPWGFSVEVLDGDVLVDDAREHGPQLDRDVHLISARAAAREMAVKHGLTIILYDINGERDEIALFG